MFCVLPQTAQTQKFMEWEGGGRVSASAIWTSSLNQGIHQPFEWQRNWTLKGSQMSYSMPYGYLSTECDPILSAYRQGLEGFPSSSLRPFTEHRKYFSLQTEMKSLTQWASGKCPQRDVGVYRAYGQKKPNYLHPVISLKTKMHRLLYKVIRNFRSVLHKHQETLDTFPNTGREILST